jgi:hypothetical protein
MCACVYLTFCHLCFSFGAPIGLLPEYLQRVFEECGFRMDATRLRLQEEVLPARNNFTDAALERAQRVADGRAARGAGEVAGAEERGAEEAPEDETMGYMETVALCSRLRKEYLDKAIASYKKVRCFVHIYVVC